MKLNEQLLLTEYYQVATCMQEDKKINLELRGLSQK
jgi:hypothetical protein